MALRSTITLQLPAALGLIIATAMLAAGCKGCNSSSPEEPAASAAPSGPVRMMIDDSLFAHLQPLLARRFPAALLKRAGFAGQLEAVRTAAVDVVVVAGEKQMRQLEKLRGFLGPPRGFAANKIELVAPKKGPLLLDRPQHLLQPALRGPAIVAAGEAAGDAARAILTGWGLAERLAGKLSSYPTSREALDAVRQGRAGAAFVFRTDRLAASDLTVRLNLAARVSNHTPYFVAVPTGGRDPAQARDIADFLAGEEVRKILLSAGLLPPEHRPPAEKP
ncbi:MAG: hypothetical protein C4523_16865 [Myxococcales bacterium]|nr:MAG: hypothetical protein C4523_16865 [Myxococcales bacterium]